MKISVAWRIDCVSVLESTSGRCLETKISNRDRKTRGKYRGIVDNISGTRQIPIFTIRIPKFTNCAFQIVALLCTALACGNAVVLSGYNGAHALSYNDYGDLDGYVASNEYKVLPTVAVPVHSVSASPLHIDASLDHGYKHGGDHEHDYYVSMPSSGSDVYLAITFSITRRGLAAISTLISRALSMLETCA